MPQVVQTLKSLSSIPLLAVTWFAPDYPLRAEFAQEICLTPGGKINLTKPSRFKTNPLIKPSQRSHPINA